MDVRCDRCQTEYELDEMRLTASGVAVKCTNCGNVFKVRRALGEDIVPAKQKVREWHVRRQDGTTLTLRELTDLQKAVVERRVAPEDSVSLSGESWHQLGAMPELASFFEVVRAASKVQAPQRQTAPAPRSPAPAPRPPAVPQRVAAAPTQLTPPLSPAPTAPPSTDSGIRRSLTPIWGEGPQSFGPTPVSAEPAWAASAGQPVDPELTELLEREDLQAVKGGRSGVWIALVLLLLAGGGVAGYFFVMHAGPFAPAAGVPPRPPDVTAEAPILAPKPDEKPPEKAVDAKPAVPAPPEAKPGEAKPAEPKPAPVVAAATPTVPAAAPTPVPAPAPTAKPAAAPAPVAAAKPTGRTPAKESEGGAAPSGRSFDYYISQGHKLLDSKPTQALALFQKAAESDPSSPEPDSGRGLAYANMDRLGEAAAAFQAALKKSPEFTEAIMGLAEISREQGNAKKAIGLYQRYLDLTPDGTDAPAARAQLEQLKSAQPAPAPKAVVATPVAAAPAPVEAAPAPAPQPKSADTEPAPPPVVVPDSPPPSSP